MKNKIKYIYLIVDSLLIVLLLINVSNKKMTYASNSNYDDQIYFLKVDETTSDSIIIKADINNEAHCAIVDMMNPSIPSINNQADANAQLYYNQNNNSYNSFCSSTDNGIKVKNYLTSIGCNHVDFIIFTHNHSDHIGGAAIVATSSLIDENTVIFYKHDVMATDANGNIYNSNGEYIDYEERTGWKNNELLTTSLEAFNSKNVKLCDVSGGCNLNAIGSEYITHVGSIPNTIDEYKTNVDYTYYFSFGNFSVNLYNLYHISNNRENMNSIVTLLTHKNGSKAVLLGDQETSVYEYDRSGDMTMEGTIAVPTEDPNYPGQCDKCKHLGVENQISDIIGEVDIVKAAHHGYDSSNSYYSMMQYNPKFIIVPSTIADTSSTKSIMAISKLLAKTPRNTKTYYSGQSSGAVVAIFGNDNKSISIEDYTYEATPATQSTLTDFSTTTGDGWYHLNNLTMQDKKYIYLENGNFVYGFKKVGNYWYYMNDEGLMSTDWQYLNYNNSGYYWYYFTKLGEDNSGSMKTGWLTLNDKTYYLRTKNNEYGEGPSGSMVTGFANIDNNWYYFGSNGAMIKGWIKINYNNNGDKWYYFDENGIMQTGWQYLNYNDSGYYWYYFTEIGESNSGSMKTGWLTINNNTYYLRENAYEYGGGPHGSMMKGLKTIDGKIYYFRNSTNEISEGPEGAAVINQCYVIDSNEYCFNSEGYDTKNGIITINNYNVIDNIVANILPNTSVQNLDIRLSGEYKYRLLDKNLNSKNGGKVATGDILEIYLNSSKLTEYHISIKGDVDGDGDSDSNDLSLIAKHIIDKNILNGEEYIKASDYDDNNIIKMNDVARMLTSLQ